MLLVPLQVLAIEDENDREFMEQLYLSMYSLMLRTAIRVLGQREDAEDTVHNTCISLCSKIHLLRGMSCNKLQSYVVISVRNSAVNLIRKRTRQPELLLGEMDYLDNLLSDQEKVEDDAFAFVNQDNLANAILQLPSKERSLIERKYILQHSDQQIAEDFDVKPASIRVMLYRARHVLLEKLEGLDSEEKN